MGNRDLNKLRLSSELSESDMKRPIDDIGRPFWDRTAKSLREHLEEIQENEGSDLDKLNTRAERLRYMLKHTLGCPDTFEFRREEMQILTQIYGQYPPNVEHHDITPIHTKLDAEETISAIKVTDEEVVDSFLHEMSPEGSLRQYLKLSSIAAIVGSEYSDAHIHFFCVQMILNFPICCNVLQLPFRYHFCSRSHRPNDNEIRPIAGH